MNGVRARTIGCGAWLPSTLSWSPRALRPPVPSRAFAGDLHLHLGLLHYFCCRCVNVTIVVAFAFPFLVNF